MREIERQDGERRNDSSRGPAGVAPENAGGRGAMKGKKKGRRRRERERQNSLDGHMSCPLWAI